MINTASAQTFFWRGRSLVALLLILAIAPTAHAQMEDRAFIDSLIARSISQAEDTNKLNTLRLLVDSIREPVEQWEYTEQLGALAELLSHAKAPSVRRKAELGRAKYLYQLGCQEHKDELLHQALAHFEECIGILKEGGDRFLLLSAASMAGGTAYNLGHYAKAMEYFTLSYRIAEAEGFTGARAHYLNNLAALYSSQNDFERADEYHLQSLAEAERIQDTALIVAELTSRAWTHLNHRDTTKALELAEQAYATARKSISARSGMQAPLEIIGGIHLHRGQVGEAEEDFTEMLEAYEEAEGRGISTQRALLSLAQVRMAQDQPWKALELARRAMEISRGFGHSDISMAAAQLEEIYKRLERTADALEMADLQLQMRDSIDYTTTTKALARHEYQQKFLADSLLQVNERATTAATHAAAMHSERNRRNLFLFSGIGVLLVAGGLWNRLRFSRRAQKEADELRLRAEHSERAKHQFLANMSHEIRTPMNAIMGMTGILQRKDHPAEQDRYLNAIKQSSDSLLVILNDILDLSKIVAGKFEQEEIPFQLHEVIGNVREILQFKAEEKGLVLELDVASDLPPRLVGDPIRLQQVLLNLAGNAIKFTEKGGVTVRAIVQEVIATHAWLCIQVTDTGIGIPEDKQEKIFLEFDQAYSDTTRKYGGTGLGLAISKRLVEMRGGTITVQSEKDKGSTFTIIVPYAITSSETGNRQQTTESNAIELRDLRILLAEDNAFNTIVAQDELHDAIPGVQVDVATNGREALAMVKAKAYDVVLMDIQMPEMNGYDAARAIRALESDRSKIPIIAMTATVMQAELELCREAGMDGHIPKPFTREQLLGSISAVFPERVPGRGASRT